MNPTMTAIVPSRGSSAIIMPPVLGKYTSMLFQVEQNFGAPSRSPHLQFDGFGELDDTMDHS
jgi:hypothetical protein